MHPGIRFRTSACQRSRPNAGWWMSAVAGEDAGEPAMSDEVVRLTDGLRITGRRGGWLELRGRGLVRDVAIQECDVDAVVVHGGVRGLHLLNLRVSNVRADNFFAYRTRFTGPRMDGLQVAHGSIEGTVRAGQFEGVWVGPLGHPRRTVGNDFTRLRAASFTGGFPYGSNQWPSGPDVVLLRSGDTGVADLRQLAEHPNLAWSQCLQLDRQGWLLVERDGMSEEDWAFYTTRFPMHE